MKKGALLCGIILTAFVLSSCADNINTAAQITDGDLVDISELAANSDKYNADLNEQTYTNLGKGEKITVTFPEEIGVYNVKERDNLDELSEMLIEKYVPKDEYDESNITINSEEKYGRDFGTQYYDTENGTMVLVGNTGFINTANQHSVSNFNESESTKIYIGQNYEDKTIKFSDGEAKISELVDMAKIELEDYAKTVKSEMGFYPRWFSYCSVDGVTCCNIEFAETYKGTQLMGSLSGTYSSFGGAVDSNTLLSSMCANSYFTSSKHTDGFVIQKDFSSVEKEEDNGKILSPAAAIRIAGAKLSGYKTYNVLDIALTYIAVNDTDIANELPMNLTFHPYWHITADSDGSEQAIYIDCYTGEMETIFG